MNQEIAIAHVVNANSLQITKTLIGQADDLAQEHENFHEHFIVGGRAALYELLSKIYELAEQLKSAADKEDQLELMKTVLAQKHGIRTQENTSDTTLLVRYITKADRKTAHVYSRAIESAHQNGIPSGSFISYVEQAGGVERIRSNAVATSDVAEAGISEESLEDMMRLAKDYLQARTELPLASFRSPKNIRKSTQQGVLSHFICHERNGRQYVLTNLDISKHQEATMIEEFARYLCVDIKAAKKDINKFYAKAMVKRKQRTLRQIAKKRPELAMAIKHKSSTSL